MKKSTFYLLLYAAIFLIAALVSSCSKETIECRKTERANRYAEYLESIGYSSDWAYKKAYVEYGLIPADDEYKAIEED